MLPIMFATSKKLGALPSFPSDRIVDWLPIDTAARTIHEILSSSSCSAEYAVHNVTNPNPINWSEFIGLLQGSRLAEKPLRVVPIKEWVHKLLALDKAGASVEDVPGLRLLDFFVDVAKESELKDCKGEVRKPVTFDTVETRRMSVALNECPAIKQEWINLYVKVWKEEGFI
jgi:hypothetical protein